MSETSCHFKTKFMKLDNSDFGMSYLFKCDFTQSILAKKGTYAHSKFETYFS
jgi:hypothetical protein